MYMYGQLPSHAYALSFCKIQPNNCEIETLTFVKSEEMILNLYVSSYWPVSAAGANCKRI